MNAIGRNEITTALRTLGAADRPLLLVHSSLSSFGHVNGGAAAVAGALQDLAGDTVSVFVPTFNFGQLAYDAATTKSLTGAISESVRSLPNSHRSLHPTHPLSGFGRDAERILSSHPVMQPFGVQSPIWQLWKENGQVLLLGCDHRSSSMIHVAEAITNQPYLNRTRIGRVIENGVEREIAVTRPPCSKGFNAIDEPLRSAGKILETKIGQANVTLMSATDIVAAAIGLLERNSAALLCHDLDCVICARSRQMIDNSV